MRRGRPRIPRAPSSVGPAPGRCFLWGDARADAPRVPGHLAQVVDHREVGARGVRQADTLDESGQVTGRAYGYVFGIVPVFNRTPFNVPLQTAGASYRLTVTSFEWRDTGGGGM